MTLIRLTEPEQEPITLDQAKLHLRVDHDEEDEGIQAAISAARGYAEDYCSRVWAAADFALLLDSFSGTIELPIDTNDVAEIAYTDAQGDRQVLDAAEYVVDLERRTVSPAGSWPSGSEVRLALRIGPDPADSPPAFPPLQVVQAMKMLLGDFYDNREASIVGAARTENPAVERLLHFHRAGLGV